jgi:hypothetical protein
MLLLRSLLGGEYRHEQTPGDVDWDRLPDRSILVLHSPPNQDELARHLSEAGYRCVTLARHPFDVLVSWARYTSSPGFARSLARSGYYSLIGVEPGSEAFMDYALGPQAHHMLGLTVAWWRREGTTKLRYEDLVADAARTLSTFVATLGVLAAPDAVSQAVLAASPTGANRAPPGHVWSGASGAWRRLIVSEDARRLAAAHPDSLAVLGYAADADPELTRAAAAENWSAMTRGSR